MGVEKTPIGTGPIQDKYGKAVVETLVGGVETQYAIQAQPVEEEDPEQRSGDGNDQDTDQSGIRLIQVESTSILDEEDDRETPIVVEAKNVATAKKKGVV